VEGKLIIVSAKIFIIVNKKLCDIVYAMGIIIIGTTTHKESWTPAEASSTLLNSWLLPTNSLIPASLHPFPLHLSTWLTFFPLFLVLPVAHTSVS
jgi:hypothetical protein